MIATAQALAAVLDLVAPLPAEPVPLRAAAGRVLAEPVTAARSQPPFDSSAMDGYALRLADARPGARLTVIGTAAAGHGSGLSVGPGQALRIFTGAPVPRGAETVVIQEDVQRDGDTVILGATLDSGHNIRPAGGDFTAGDRWFPRRPLTPADLMLLAAMNCPAPQVTRKPVVALIATGDELVMPGETPRADQIVASNGFGLAAMVDRAGGIARMLPIARDTEPALRTAFALARDADIIVTIGGASVGDHDMVGRVAGDLGLERAFYKVALRPGKPLMAGRLNGVPMLGLPGNPVSAMVCGHVFLVPALRAFLGLGKAAAPEAMAPLAADLPANGPREHYMRATLSGGTLTAATRQDSALASVLADANALIRRPVDDIARKAGEPVPYLPL